MKRLLLSGIGMRELVGGPRVEWLYRGGPRGGRIENEDRCTQRTTLWTAPCGLDIMKVFKKNGDNNREQCSLTFQFEHDLEAAGGSKQSLHPKAVGRHGQWDC